jgi:hypothetical protein
MARRPNQIAAPVIHKSKSPVSTAATRINGSDSVRAGCQGILLLGI